MTTSKTSRITLFINSFIAKHARAQAIYDELSLSKLVEKALIAYLPKDKEIFHTKEGAGNGE